MAGREPGTGFRPRDWGLILLAVVAMKQGYSLARADQLQWILAPLALALEALSDLSFQPLPSGEWLDAGHHVLLVKACAGGNFLLVSWLAYLWRWQRSSPRWRFAVAAFALAWLTALAANALRILLLVHGQDDISRVSGLTAENSHRLVGIGVYFICLWLQLAKPGRYFSALLVAAVLYLGINLLLPALRAWLLGLPPLDPHHVLWSAGLPAVLVLTWGLAHVVRLRRA